MSAAEAPPTPPGRPAAVDKEEGDGGDDEEPEDLMGDQSWAKSDDFSGGMDSLFADMMGGQSVDEMRADLAAQGVDVNAEVSGIGEDAAAAEAEEAKRKAEEEAEAAAEEEKRKKAEALREKRKNMTKEEKMAKMKVKPLQKKAEAMKEDGTLVDEAQYEEGMRLVEEEEWLAAEKALKAATAAPCDGDDAAPDGGEEAAPQPDEAAPEAAPEPESEPEPKPEPEPEPEPEPPPKPPPAAEPSAAMKAGAEAVTKVLAGSKKGNFTEAVALLKAAVASDKAGRKTEGLLMYMAAADRAAKVDADPKEAKKKKAGLAKKIPAVDDRVAKSLKDSKTLFSELDKDNSGTIDEGEFGQLMESLSLVAEPGQFAAIDTDGSGAIECAPDNFR